MTKTGRTRVVIRSFSEEFLEEENDIFKDDEEIELPARIIFWCRKTLAEVGRHIRPGASPP